MRGKEKGGERESKHLSETRLRREEFSAAHALAAIARLAFPLLRVNMRGRFRASFRASVTSNSELSEIVAFHDIRETPPRLLRDVGDKARARARALLSRRIPRLLHAGKKLRATAPYRLELRKSRRKLSNLITCKDCDARVNPLLLTAQITG